MNTKHTPGPWEAEFSETYNVRASHGGTVAQIHHLKGRHGVYGRIDSEEAAANARLISAAPDLLAALEEGSPPLPELLEWVADRFVSVHGVSPHMDYVTALRRHAGKARAAIAKAKGEA